MTSELVERWCAAAKGSASMASMRQLLKAYRVACHYSDSEEETEASLSITSSHVFNRLMLFVLKEVRAASAHATHLKYSESLNSILKSIPCQFCPPHLQCSQRRSSVDRARPPPSSLYAL